MTPTILLSTAVSESKTTTNGYKITQLHTLHELLHTMNREAVASGLFSNGHRHRNYLKAIGNVYFIDIDTPPSAEELIELIEPIQWGRSIYAPSGAYQVPYYQTIEAKLRELNISFISVPSKSADTYTYKRHIAIILDGYLPTAKKAFHETAQYILDTLGVDLNKIDERVAFNNIAFLAPASINKNFINHDEVSTVYEGEPLTIPKHLQGVYDKAISDQRHIKSNQLVKFLDGSTVTVHEAKKLIAIGTKKPCYCPIHEDNNPSATFYHNPNGSVRLFCGKCGEVKISTDFIPKTPNILHQDYNYSIILNNTTQAKIRALLPKMGTYSYKMGFKYVWCYSVSSISDIYSLLLAKMYLADNGYTVSTEHADKRPSILLSTSTLKPMIKNVTPPKAFIPKGIRANDSYYQHKQIALHIFNHYLFVEVTIYATYQNIIAPNRTFNDTCNLGLAYFDYVLQVQSKEKSFKQTDKTYPMRLKLKEIEPITQERIKSMDKAKKIKMTVRQIKLIKLIQGGLYEKSNGKPNIRAIAKKLKVKSTKTIYKDLKIIESKKKRDK